MAAITAFPLNGHFMAGSFTPQQFTLGNLDDHDVKVTLYTTVGGIRYDFLYNVRVPYSTIALSGGILTLSQDVVGTQIDYSAPFATAQTGQNSYDARYYISDAEDSTHSGANGVFKVYAGPVFGTPTFTDVPYPGMPEEYSFVSGYSRVQVSIPVNPGGASLRWVYCYPGGTSFYLQKQQGTNVWVGTSGIITGNSTFLFSSIDERDVAETLEYEFTSATTLPVLSVDVSPTSLAAFETVRVTPTNNVGNWKLAFKSGTVPVDDEITNISTSYKDVVTSVGWFVRAGSTSSSMQVTAAITDAVGRTATKKFYLSKPYFGITLSASQVLVTGSLSVTFQNAGSETVHVELQKNGEALSESWGIYNVAGNTTLTISDLANCFTYSGETGSTVTVDVVASFAGSTVKRTITVKYPALTIARNKSTAAVGESITFTVGNRAGESYHLALTYGAKSIDTLPASGSYTTDTAAISSLKQYFDTAQNTRDQSISINVKAYDSRGRSASISFTLTANNAMKPQVSTPTATIQQPSPASTTFPSTYIANVSKVKISATCTFPTLAGKQSVVLTYPGAAAVNMSLASGSETVYEATIPNPLTGDTTFTVTVTDQRGLQTVKTVAVTGVLAYAAPVVNIINFYRCTSTGVKSDTGDHCLMNVGFDITPLNNQNLKTVAISSTIYSNSQTPTSYSGTVEYLFAANIENSYAITVTVTDAITSTSKTVRLSTAGVIMDFLRTGHGVGIGKVAETENAVEISSDWTLKCANINFNGTDLANWIDRVNQALGFNS